MTQHGTAGPEPLLASLLSGAAGYAGRAAELLTECSLTVDRWRVLELVARHSEVTMSGLATQLGVPSSTATRIVDHLVSDGALYRAVDMVDRRRVLLRVTDRGRTSLGEALHQLEPLEAEIGRLIGPERPASRDGRTVDHQTRHLVDKGRARHRQDRGDATAPMRAPP